MNFKTILHEGAAYVAYDFSNFFDRGKILKPFISIGISVFEFNNKGWFVFSSSLEVVVVLFLLICNFATLLLDGCILNPKILGVNDEMVIVGTKSLSYILYYN